MDTAKEVDYPYSEISLATSGGDKEVPSIGNLGGGSDHIGFYMHVGVPSMSGGVEALQCTTQIMIHFVITSDLLIPNFKWAQRLKNSRGL